MATPHINAERGDFADVVLMPATRCARNTLQKIFWKILNKSTMCVACWVLPEPIKAAVSP